MDNKIKIVFLIIQNLIHHFCVSDEMKRKREEEPPDRPTPEKQQVQRKQVKSSQNKFQFCGLQNFHIYTLQHTFLEFSEHNLTLWSKFGVDITKSYYMRKAIIAILT